VKTRIRLALSLLTIATLPLFGALAPAQQGGIPAYVKNEVMIAMRDGVKLNTAVLTPKDAKGPLPFVFLRTPYGIAGSEFRVRSDYLKDLAKEGYIFVFQDIRGRFKSEGQFVMSRSPRDKADPKAIDESTDAYDTIDWLLKNVPDNNGRVGMLGISYDGWTTAMAMIDPHPALKAVSPQASPADMFMGDDFHHQGAFRLSYGFEYVALMETNKVNTNFKFDRRDTFDWYLKLGALSHVNEQIFQGKMPTWNDFVAHPNYDEFWQKQAFAPYLKRVTVPTLNVAGWWDQEDFYGPLKIYELLEPHDKKDMNFLVVGPWNHGGWSAGPGDKLGRIGFGSATGKHYREKVQAPFFAFHLKDKGELKLPEALTFQTGSNQWVSHDRWPPRAAAAQKLYFHPDGKLAFEPPAGGPVQNFDTYVSDPAHPVPYRPRPIPPTYPGREWREWMLEDQRFVHNRPDVLTWETEPLKEDVVVAGSQTAHLFASTTGTDCDWIVRIIDVYPEKYADPTMAGYQLLITGDVLRGRFRKSFEKPEPIAPNQVNEFTVDLHWGHHCFRKGHKIMVAVQSTWFPVIDRNPQKYVENIFKARDTDFQPARMRVYRSPQAPSHVRLQLMNTARGENGVDKEARRQALEPSLLNGPQLWLRQLARNP
jgi:putative CocE/NonD family hydrolase